MDVLSFPGPGEPGERTACDLLFHLGAPRGVRLHGWPFERSLRLPMACESRLEKKRPSVYSAKGHVCARRSGCLRWVEGSKVSVGKEKNFFDELVIFSACVQICARSFVDFVRVCLVFDHEVILGSWFKVPGSRF